MEINALPARPDRRQRRKRRGWRGSRQRGRADGCDSGNRVATAARMANRHRPRLLEFWPPSSRAFAIMRLFGLERTWYLDTLVAFTPYVALLSLLLIPATILARRWWTTGIAVATAIAFARRPRAPCDRRSGSGAGAGTARAQLEHEDRRGRPGRHRGARPAPPYGRIGAGRIHATGAAAPRRGRDRLVVSPTAPRRRCRVATGSAIFSRYPLHDIGYRPLAGGFGQEYATVTVPGALPLIVEAVHPEAPAVPSTNAIWAAGLAAQPAATPNGPVRLLIGDFSTRHSITRGSGR